jgi:hypothetical protein
MALSDYARRYTVTALGDIAAGTEVADILSAASALSSSEAAFIDGVTAGTVAADKAVVADSDLRVSGLLFPVTARTATADGTTTGTIADAGGLQFIVPTSASANNIIVLPSPDPGVIVVLAGTANGYELRSSAPATVAINGGTGSAVESAIAASTLVVAICESATSWKAFQIGADGTLAQVEAAA